MVDQFALTSTFSLSNGANQITANLARANNGESPGLIGTGMTAKFWCIYFSINWNLFNNF